MDASLLAAGNVRVEVDGAVMTVTLDRAEARNAQTPATWAALVHVGRELTPDVRVVILRGAGPTFSAGLDRRMFTPDGIPGEPSLLSLAAASDDEIDAQISAYQDAFTWWRASDAITIAAVQGHAIGAGFQLALGCDLIVADETALFSMKEPSFGLVPDLAGTAPLVEAVGYSRALEICTSSRSVGAEEALRIGLVVAVAAAGEINGVLASLIAPIVANPAGSVTATKHLLRGAAHRHPVDQRAAERDAQRDRLRELAALAGFGS
ncbi:MAG: enoyl-CoA hydratase/isomerase family protein [Actinomycetes bacterium]